MYVVSFYSFKGGVGRTMALVNIGVELARSGRRVLMVDFDLEAPGIETFNLPKPRKQPLGVLDYVLRYVETREAPDAGEYIYESLGIGEDGGRLWIMPPGKRDQSYASRLSGIDWQNLYSNHDGYFLFEDLKAQWRTLLEPDYVLIDSRTGYTDVGGICTRQLPDAVTILFFPNEQNLLGLKSIVDEIRKEADVPREKKIQIHFVTSNIPDIDDEDQILETRMKRFRESLGYQELSGTIHHYNSLALLNQVVFTMERPRSRLAQEFRDLLKTIALHNPEDRAGVLEFLKSVRTRAGEIGIAAGTLEERLDRVQTSHAEDGEILFRLARIRERQGRIEAAIALLNEAIEAKYLKSEVLLFRAELHRINGDLQKAVTDLKVVLNLDDATYFDVSRAIRWLRDSEPNSLISVTDSRALAALDFEERLQIAAELATTRSLLTTSEKILRQLAVDRQSSIAQHARVNTQLSLCLVGLGRFVEAKQTLSPTRPRPSELTIQDAFNYAYAEWMETGTPPRDFFDWVIAANPTQAVIKTANYSQCLALAYWATGKSDLARERTTEARQQMLARRHPEFSCWRYLIVPPEGFLDDLESINELIDGKSISPPLLSQKRKTTHSRARKG